jgi:hypothetical protein
LQPGGHRFDPGQLHQKPVPRHSLFVLREALDFANDEGRANDQLSVGRQDDNRFRITVQRKSLGAEHWVGRKQLLAVGL